MKKILSSLFALCSATFLFAQTIVVKQPNGTETIFNRLDSAIIQSPSGSVYVLSGGFFPYFGNFNINKQVTIIGAGYHQDSTQQSFKTIINGYFNIYDGGDNSSFMGFECSGFQLYNPFNSNIIVKVKNIAIKRVKFSGISASYSNSNPIQVNPNISNISISECIFQSGSFGNASLVRISNSIITSCLGSLINGLVENNIFYYNGSHIFIYGGVYRNNIYLNPGSCGNTNFGNYAFYNNLQLGVSTFQPPNNPIATSGNLATSSTNPNDIFVNYPTGIDLYNDFHLFDFHIKPNTIAKNAGTDGKDLGIYGGDGFRAIPAIPWIEYKNVAKQTNNQGQLPINFRVKAKN